MLVLTLHETSNMGAWTGGSCPGCGEYMPENLIHCQVCRALLNPELTSDSVEIPEFIPLQEISSMVDVSPVGHYILCPRCNQELRTHGKYRGQHVQCKFCHGQFKYAVDNQAVRVVAIYSSCPHCSQELRAALKYVGMKVACKHCNGNIHILAE